MADELDRLAKLREPFPQSRIGLLPKGRTKLEYVGHGAVTERLLDIDPQWNWEPVSFDGDGNPTMVRDAQGRPTAFWVRLTACGITRLGVGTCAPGIPDAEKVLIGDALRNAAMRFGVALDLWVRGQAEDDEQVSTPAQFEAPPEPKVDKATAKAIEVAYSFLDDEHKALLDDWAKKRGVTTWRDLTVAQAETLKKSLKITSEEAS